MAAKKLMMVENTEHYVLKVYKDYEWQEYNAKVYRLGTDKKLCVSSYHSDDLDDAINTGKTCLAHSELHQVMEPAID